MLCEAKIGNFIQLVLEEMLQFGRCWTTSKAFHDSGTPEPSRTPWHQSKIEFLKTTQQLYHLILDTIKL